MTDIVAIGERLNLTLFEGRDFGTVSVTVSHSDTGLPFDLTGATIRGQARKTPGDATVIAAFATAITNPTGGQFTFTLVNTEAAKLVGGAPTTPPIPGRSKFVWDLEIRDAFGNIKPLYWGDVISQTRVTV